MKLDEDTISITFFHPIIKMNQFLNLSINININGKG